MCFFFQTYEISSCKVTLISFLCHVFVLLICNMEKIVGVTVLQGITYNLRLSHTLLDLEPQNVSDFQVFVFVSGCRVM